MTGTRAKSDSRASFSKVEKSTARGRLIVVASADPALRDVMLRIVARRLAGCDVIFQEPLTTKPLPAGSGKLVSRNTFALAQQSGDMALAWRNGTQSCGHAADLTSRLAAGGTLVLGIDVTQADRARTLWPDVRLIRLGTRMDRLRSGALASCEAATIVHDDSNPAATIRALSDAMMVTTEVCS